MLEEPCFAQPRAPPIRVRAVHLEPLGDLARLYADAALQASACAAATALVEPWAALEPVFDPEEIASPDERHAEASSRAAGVHILAEEDEEHQYVTVYEGPGERASHWFRLFGPGADELEAAIERGAASGAPPAALAAGLEALAAGNHREADRVIRESIGS